MDCDLQEYRQEYETCQSSLGLAKKIVAAKDFIEQTCPPKVILELRKKWTDFFSQEELSGVCGDCRGFCCLRPAYFPMSSLELLYLVSWDPDFIFPQPDWSFLEEKVADPLCRPCLFASEKGCLLGENKPGSCISWVCQPLREKAKSLKLDIDSEVADRKQAEKEYSAWAQRIVDYSHSEKAKKNELHRLVNQPPALEVLRILAQ